VNDHRTGPLSAAIAEAEVQTFSFADEKGAASSNTVAASIATERSAP
jgi:hypothetical protein